ncbi:MAG TPA: hypothetical protein VII11_07700 [Bacteroidota bacterium]
MNQRLFIAAVLLALGCAGTAQLPDYSNSANPLPDLHIKKIEYKIGNKQRLQRFTTRDPSTARLEYEFTLLVENIGNKAFQEPFYLSVSGSPTDYEDYLYSRHIRLNDENLIVEPGQVVRFVVPLVLDFPHIRARLSHYPVRFYLNTEGSQNSTGFPTLFIAERSYENNFYELQIRL